jgi:hypothetical protein
VGYAKLLSENLKERHHLADLGTDDNHIKSILNCFPLFVGNLAQYADDWRALLTNAMKSGDFLE